MSDASSGKLKVLTAYPSSVEAGFAQQLLAGAGIKARLDGEAVATNFYHYGTATGGCRLLVHEADLRVTAEILTEEGDGSEEDFLARGEAEGGEGDESDPATDAAPKEPSHELRRAYHAAIIGLFLFPFAVSLYSLYLMVRHRLFLPDRGGNDWRFYVAMTANTFGICLTKLCWS